MNRVRITQSKDEFKAWLRSLPPDTTFCRPGEMRCQTCPIARFTGESTHALILPDWAETFMRRYDEQASSSLRTALEISETI